MVEGSQRPRGAHARERERRRERECGGASHELLVAREERRKPSSPTGERVLSLRGSSFGVDAICGMIVSSLNLQG